MGSGGGVGGGSATFLSFKQKENQYGHIPDSDLFP